jgi:hypothetical protein
MNRRHALPALLTVAAALATAGCATTTVTKTASPPAAASTQAPATLDTAAPSPSDSSSSLTGSIGTTFTVTSSDGTSYEVTLDRVTQRAALSPYETLSNAQDHAAAAEFTITGVTGQSSDDANNDANAIGSDQTEYQPATVSLTVPNFSYGEFKVAPGQTEKGWVAYELPPGVTVAQVQWAPGLNSAAATWTVSG